MHDYPSKVILVGFFIKEQEASTAERRDKFGQELFDKFDEHIKTACASAQPPLPSPSPEARALMAVMARHAKGGTNERRAENAVAAYLTHRGW